VPPGPNDNRSAPWPAVPATHAPAAIQRAITSLRGSPKRLSAPVATIAHRGATAAMKAGSDDVRLPWCGTTTTSARNAAPCSRASRRSTTAPMSPGSSAAPPRVRTCNTHELSLRRLGKSGGGCSSAKSTSSQRHAAGARQPCASATTPSGASTRA